MKADIKTFDCEPVHAHDGDTIDVIVYMPGDFGFSSSLKHPLRLAGLNCPELATPAGLTARDFTVQWLTKHPAPYSLTIRGEGRDKYGRVLGTLRAVDGACLNDDLLSSGNAVVMKG